jgi:hypothetical protein
MGGVGMLQGAQQDKQAREQMKMNAMNQRFAPLFGQAPGAAQVAPEGGALRGGLAGALGGLQTSMNYDMMKNAMAKAQTPATGQMGLVSPQNQAWSYGQAIGPQNQSPPALATNHYGRAAMGMIP